METSTLEAPAAVAQPESHESQTETAAAQPEKKSGSSNKAETLRKLLRREKENPNVKFTDAELDILDEHYSGKLQPAKGKPHFNEIRDNDTPSEEKPEEVKDKPETAEPAEEPEEVDTQEEDDSQESDPDADALMKEVGAKNLKEAVAKVKELRRALGGKDAQAVAKLSKELETHKSHYANEERLWADAKAGKAEALQFIERRLGRSLSAPQQQAPSYQSQQRQPQQEGEGYIPRDRFIDEESADLVNQAFSKQEQRLKQLESVIQEFNQERDRNRQMTAEQQGRMQTVDEMARVAARIPQLKDIPNLRAEIDKWFNGGVDDSRMELFNDLFSIATKEGCSLEAAWKIKRADDAELEIARAQEQGRQSAFNHKPNPSLSGMTGGKGESYHNYTDDQLEAMSEDWTKMPPDWLDDKTGEPVKSRIPRRAWKYFDLN